MIFPGEIVKNQVLNLLFLIKFVIAMVRKLTHSIKMCLNSAYFDWVSLRINVKNCSITGV